LEIRTEAQPLERRAVRVHRRPVHHGIAGSPRAADRAGVSLHLRGVQDDVDPDRYRRLSEDL